MTNALNALNLHLGEEKHRDNTGIVFTALILHLTPLIDFLEKQDSNLNKTQVLIDYLIKAILSSASSALFYRLLHLVHYAVIAYAFNSLSD